MTHHAELRASLKGPIYPILPAFKEDGTLDYDATATYVEYIAEHQVSAVMVTVGTSRFNLLTLEEMHQLNDVVIQAANGKTKVIAANPLSGSTKHAIEFAQKTQTQGADMLLVYYPERYYNDDAVYDYYASIGSATDMGLMIHANPMRKATGGVAYFSVDLCRRLAEDGYIMGMKEEHKDSNHRYKLATHLSSMMTFIVAGTGMRMFVESFLFGVQAYLVGVGSFKPSIEEQFYNDLMAGRYDDALSVVRNYEEKFFDVAMPMGWHIAMKGTLNLLGLMEEHERLPLNPATEAQVNALRDVITDFGWID